MASRGPTTFRKSGVSVKYTAIGRMTVKAFHDRVCEQVLRPTAHAGALVVYNELKARVPVKDGELKDSIYRWFDTKNSRYDRKIYLIGPNKAKAPHWYVVEYGHWRYNRSFRNRWLKSKSNPNARGPQAHDLPGALAEPVWVPARPYGRESWTAVSDRIIPAMLERMRVRFAESFVDPYPVEAE